MSLASSVLRRAIDRRIPGLLREDDPIGAAAIYLWVVLGGEYAALIVGVEPGLGARGIAAWVDRDDAPQNVEAAVLMGETVTKLFVARASVQLAREWLAAPNPVLGGDAPALALRQRPADVLGAAQRFLSLS